MTAATLPTPLPALSPEWPIEDRRWVPWADLPPDMQVILSDYLMAPGLADWVEPDGLWARPQAVADLPQVPLDDEDEPLSADEADAQGVDRGVAYAQAMDLSKTPPIVTAFGRWLDGRHRVFRARELGQPWVWAFDLSRLISMSALQNIYKLGEITPVRDRLYDCFKADDVGGLKTLEAHVQDIDEIYQVVGGYGRNGFLQTPMETWVTKRLGLRESRLEGLTGVANPLRRLAHLAPTGRLERYTMVRHMFSGHNLEVINPRVLRRLVGQLPEADQKAVLVNCTFAARNMRAVEGLRQAWLGATERVQRAVWPDLLGHAFTTGQIEAVKACEQWGLDRGWTLSSRDYARTLQRFGWMDGLEDLTRFWLRERPVSAYGVVKAWLNQTIIDPDAFLSTHLAEPGVAQAVDRLIQDGVARRIPQATDLRRAQLRQAKLETFDEAPPSAAASRAPRRTRARA